MKQFILLLFSFSIILVSCSSDDDSVAPVDDNDFDGSVEAIENFYTPELISTIVGMGFTINEGDSPPNIEGQYTASPLQLENSNIENDFEIGHTFSDEIINLTQQDNESLTLNAQLQSGTASSVAVQSFISGSGNKFSVFLQTESTREGHTSILAKAFSGEISDDGIKNYQSVLVMLDDRGDPDNNLIANNQGRVFIDGDFISPRE